MSLPIVDPRLDGLIITVDDVVAAGHCARGMKKWFEGHGFDFRGFLANGIPAKDLLLTNDAQAVNVVRAKLSRMGQ